MKQDLQDASLKRLVKPRDELICVRVSNWHWGSDFEDVVTWPFGAEQYPVFPHLIHDSIRFLPQFNAEKESGATHVCDDFVASLQITQACE